MPQLLLALPLPLVGQAPAANPPEGPRLEPAPYVEPAVGTREVYTTFTNTISAANGWRVKYATATGSPGMRVGLFISDNPKSPVALDTLLFKRLWPLKVGNVIRVETQRYPLTWRWTLRVVGTEHVKVPAGEYDTYIVQTTQSPRIAREGTVAVTTLSLFWYAPTINSVVRFKSTRILNDDNQVHVGAELVRLERPGKPPIGAAAPASKAATRKAPPRAVKPA